MLCIISLDEHHSQQGMVQLPLGDLGINHGHHVKVTDLITDNTYNWYSEWNFIELQTYLTISYI